MMASIHISEEMNCNSNSNLLERSISISIVTATSQNLSSFISSRTGLLKLGGISGRERQDFNAPSQGIQLSSISIMRR